MRINIFIQRQLSTLWLLGPRAYLYIAIRPHHCYLVLLNALLDGRLRRWLEGQRQKVDPWGQYMHSTYLDGPMKDVGWWGKTESDETRTRLGYDRKGANLVYSEYELGDKTTLHYPMYDIDLPVRWVPSTNKGKGHLYIGKPIPWEKNLAIMEALADAGILHRNYVKHSKTRGYTCLRPPWVRKPATTAVFDSDHE